MARPDVYKGPVGPLIHRCPQCQATGPQLLRCAGCRAVRYCSHDHQIADRDGHKRACNKIKNARAKLDEEVVRNALKRDVGIFRGTNGTSDYMRARFYLAVENLLPLGTLDGVQEALYHLEEMLRLCRSDDMGLRDIVPSIMLRLDLDQECYDFTKWWATCDPVRDWDDVTLPFLNTRGAKVLEQPDFLVGKRASLNYLVPILMLKLKLLVDVLNTNLTRRVLARTRLPDYVRAKIEQVVVRSPLSADLYKHTYKVLWAIEDTLLIHVRTLGRTIANVNQYFMFDLFDPDEALATTPSLCNPGSVGESDLALQNSYAAWWSTEGTLRLLGSGRECAARASKDDIKHLMMGERFRKGEGSHRTAEELLADVSVNRLWGYLEHAIMDATYLGPLSERPSEVEMRMEAESGELDSDCVGLEQEG
ncbi:unnamed protein product [Clonostachys rosea]|uniref:MYND-type domain-containing protein n=1 Tax=Bionectria ochroleuca TaxID=29856 RepID=A0ABY6TYS8_BIOOC|nr:unnamed protein product [Clonostachys rosea]